MSGPQRADPVCGLWVEGWSNRACEPDRQSFDPKRSSSRRWSASSSHRRELAAETPLEQGGGRPPTRTNESGASSTRERAPPAWPVRSFHTWQHHVHRGKHFIGRSSAKAKAGTGEAAERASGASGLTPRAGRLNAAGVELPPSGGPQSENSNGDPGSVRPSTYPTKWARRPMLRIVCTGRKRMKERAAFSSLFCFFGYFLSALRIPK